jgi:hypothetical protein
MAAGTRRLTIAVAGAGFSAISRYSDRPLGALAVEACQKALAEAGAVVVDHSGHRCVCAGARGQRRRCGGLRPGPGLAGRAQPVPDMAPLIVANRLNASRNPDAVFYQKPIDAADYLNSPVVSTPMSYLDCDMPVDGCGALLVTRADLAADGPSIPAYVAGAVAHGIARRHAPAILPAPSEASAKEMAGCLWDRHQRQG